jgi:4'-phosphopantetheinyl transferase EntD
MARDTACEEQGNDFHERREHRNREHIAARHQQALQRLGYQVTLARIAGHQPVPA